MSQENAPHEVHEKPYKRQKHHDQSNPTTDCNSPPRKEEAKSPKSNRSLSPDPQGSPQHVRRRD